MGVKRIALIGNPNTGKTSIFNLLTGLNQQVGNFPGVTVDKKTGTLNLDSGEKVEVIDLPGTYSVFPRSKDERVVFNILSKPNHPDFPELTIVVADSSNLERNLLLFTQLYDMGLSCILVLTMPDVSKKREIRLDTRALSFLFGGVPIIELNGRTGEGLDKLKHTIAHYPQNIQKKVFVSNRFEELLQNEDKQAADAETRFAAIRDILKNCERRIDRFSDPFSSKLDKILVHPIWGYLIFTGILLLIFQSIFNFASIPMDLIDGAFSDLSHYAQSHLPEGVFTNLLSEGIIPGIGGVVVFVPQIALLFLFLTILEETGYMARVVFIMDRLMRPFGLNGKSVVPLMSSVACAIPGVMATRSIASWKDRLITILVAPLMSCSARIPVYTLLIALVIPDTEVWGFFNLKGLVLFGLYALGVVAALLIAALLKWIINSKDRSVLLLELPSYRLPRAKYVALSVWEKVKVFVMDAGKVILAISIILWALASYGPGERIERAVAAVEMQAGESQEDFELKIASAKLENSYIGILGHAIEPAIRPLGYDWKIGIALITSFAAREVFVGSMATIYSVGEDFEADSSLLDRLREEKDMRTGKPAYNLANGASLMVFYVFAMQCMATLAVVKRETKTWKWPLIQLVYMGILAYLGAFITFTLLS
ncbi:MAG: ferrous iron transport protein B [Flavobacteriales bacterium]|jgi:ferrous iron transport protein B